ncbi:helix-turn-helix domain-containing protein [Lutimaribacter marinistellae]|uniref:Helix-turn-helix domain-containing protein n=1 Tax=Lutimaribacter marinistellae TaxID=1820329 RepID=A0ABV7TMA3_9RHOB
MDAAGSQWYFSCMNGSDPIPVFTLLGETGRFPDVIHSEPLSVRSPQHGWRIPPHRHAHLAQVFLITKGRGEAVIDGGRMLLEARHFLFIPPQKVHEFSFRPETVGQVISVPVAVVNAIGPSSADLMRALAQPVSGRVMPALAALAEMLANVAIDTGPFRAQRAVGMAHSVLAMIAETGHSRDALQADHTRLTQLDVLIARHMSDSWTARDYAAALSLTAGHLSRICRAATGRGATAYIEQARIDEACRLLAFTRLPVSEIGYRLGFSDPSYFSKRFRAARGQTPSTYRDSIVS